MKWPSPWGDGFPGWHIECSAMSMKYLGERFDIHTGGIDLKFPHHEDEIAQSEGATGHQVVSVWMHGEFLTLDDAKMASSVGNVIRVTDLPSKGFQPLDFRYLALTAHYRSKLDFTFDAMQAAAHGLRRLRRAASDGADGDRSSDRPGGGADGGLPRALRRGDQRRPGHADCHRGRARGGRGRRPCARRSVERCCSISIACWAWTWTRPPSARVVSCPPAPANCLSDARPRAPLATSRPRMRCATSWPPWASRCATRRTARRRRSRHGRCELIAEVVVAIIAGAAAPFVVLAGLASRGWRSLRARREPPFWRKPRAQRHSESQTTSAPEHSPASQKSLDRLNASLNDREATSPAESGTLLRHVDPVAYGPRRVCRACGLNNRIAAYYCARCSARLRR